MTVQLSLFFYKITYSHVIVFHILPSCYIERGPYIWTIKVAKKKGHIIQIFDDVTWILTEKDSPLSNSVWSVADNENQKSLLIARVLLLLHINMFSDYMNHTIPHHVIIVKVFQASPDPGPVRPGKSAEILLT